MNKNKFANPHLSLTRTKIIMYLGNNIWIFRIEKKKKKKKIKYKKFKKDF